MASIEKQFEELDESELKKKACFRCLASGFPFKESLYDEKEMTPSTATNDYLVCTTCHAIENEQHQKISRSEFNYAIRIVNAFEDYKKTK